ncbi:hypothetical protein GCM10009100_04480 [Thalassospira tepidiphila]
MPQLCNGSAAPSAATKPSGPSTVWAIGSPAGRTVGAQALTIPANNNIAQRRTTGRNKHGDKTATNPTLETQTLNEDYNAFARKVLSHITYSKRALGLLRKFWFKV